MERWRFVSRAALPNGSERIESILAMDVSVRECIMLALLMSPR